MKVAYLIPLFLPPESSVGQKVERAVRAWMAEGIEARVFVGDARSDAAWEVPAAVCAPRRLPHRELRRQALAIDIDGDLRRWDPDLVYSRITPYTLGLERSVRRYTLVHEVNTDDRIEFPMWGRATAAHHPRTRHLSLRQVDGFVYLTDELRRSSSYERYEKPAAVIPNGIPLAEVASYPAPSNERPLAVFLAGSPSPWQGLDKVVRMAEHLPEVDVAIAGVTGLPEGALASNLAVHGDLSGAELGALLSRADVAIGTLALHRKQMEEACPLKVREYLAHGIPTVIAYRDPSLEHLDAASLLRLPNTEDNIMTSIDELRTFILASRGGRVSRAALEHLDVEHIERRRLEFLASFVTDR